MIANLSGTPTRLCQSAVGTSASTLFTAGSEGRVAILDYNICNTGSGGCNVTIGIGGVTSGTALFYEYTIAGKSTVNLSVFHIINKSETVQAAASSTGITVTINGLDRV